MRMGFEGIAHHISLIELTIAHPTEVILKTEDMWALLAGQNTSHTGRLAQGLQNAAMLLLPADKAEVNTLRQRVDTLEVIARAYICALLNRMHQPRV